MPDSKARRGSRRARVRRATVPFGLALRELLERAGMSLRDLEQATRAADPTGKGLTNSYLSQASTWRGARITADALRKVAAALSVEPCYFEEFRGAIVREAFNPAVVGYEEFEENLRELEQLLRSRSARDLRLHAKLADVLMCEEVDVEAAGSHPALEQVQRALQGDDQ